MSGYRKPFSPSGEESQRWIYANVCCASSDLVSRVDYRPHSVVGVVPADNINLVLVFAYESNQ